MSISTERIESVFHKAERDLLRLAGKPRPEDVHSFRTTTRRLETLLQQLIPRRDRNQKKLLKSLDRIRKRAGKVRDLDVQLAALRSLKTPQEPRRKTQLTQRLLELRAEHEKRLRKPLTYETLREVRKRLKRASDRIELKSSRDPLEVARRMLEQVQLDRPITEEALHQYRIAVKQARYAAEFAPESAEARRFITRMKRLQDAIGHWHDWLTLTHSATDSLGDVNQSPLVAALHNVTGSKFRQAMAALASLARQGAWSGAQASASLSLKRRATRPASVQDIDSAA